MTIQETEPGKLQEKVVSHILTLQFFGCIPRGRKLGAWCLASHSLLPVAINRKIIPNNAKLTANLTD